MLWHLKNELIKSNEIVWRVAKTHDLVVLITSVYDVHVPLANTEKINFHFPNLLPRVQRKERRGRQRIFPFR